MNRITILGFVTILALFTSSCSLNSSQGDNNSSGEKGTIDLSENWSFSPDRDNRGGAEKWHSPGFDDSEWDIINAGDRWEDQGYPGLDGFAWYRKSVEIPADWKGKDIWVKFGGIDDSYKLFVNGISICHSGGEFSSVERIPTFAKISGLLKHGKENLIALQVCNERGSGGLRRLPVILTTDANEVANLLGPMEKTPTTPEELGYELFWEDEFEGNSLDPEKWEVRQPGPRGAGFIDSRAVIVKDGILELKTFIKNDSVLTGMVGTENCLMTKYGYFECRAELNKSWGPVPAFWIQSTEIREGEDPGKYGVEIDIFEYFKRWGMDVVSHNIHWNYGPNMHSSPSMESKLEGLDEGFHTYALEWTPEKYVFFVDGYRYYEIDYAISHIDEYIILSLLVPGTMEEMKDTVFPDSFIIDYVKVYKKRQE
ncbi:MAG: family 16 glycosylhydrolase [Bacteroidota bacterium]